jgi:hypothetical protein
MKVLFVGPTLHGEVVAGRLKGEPEIECRGPARQGDIASAVLEGATSIGLIDGRYEDVAAPWHKEILFALSHGVFVLGGGSLGALRAAECAAFGMIGVGAIFERYVSGELVDDSDIAQLHAPAEMDYIPLTEALVNIEETLRSLVASGLLDARAGSDLRPVAHSIHFKKLTFEAIVERSAVPNAEADRLLKLFKLHRVDLKRRDAHLLIARMKELPAGRFVKSAPWIMSEPRVWRRYMARRRGTSEIF